MVGAELNGVHVAQRRETGRGSAKPNRHVRYNRVDRTIERGG
jgi:hypothetical protein